MTELATPPRPAAVDDLRLTRERERQPINEFLEQRHPLGSVPGWKACFGARHEDLLVAVVVLGRPVSRAADDGTDETVVSVKANNHYSGNTFYLEPGEELEITDETPNRIVVSVAENGGVSEE